MSVLTYTGTDGADTVHQFIGNFGGVFTYYDKLYGLGGDDTFYVELTGAGETIFVDGGDGIDTVYGTGLTDVVFQNIEVLNLNLSYTGSVATLMSVQSIITNHTGEGLYFYLFGEGGAVDLGARIVGERIQFLDASVLTSGSTFTLTAKNDYIVSSLFDDVIYGGDGDDLISDTGGDNTIYGGDGADTISFTGPGYIDGGAGDDLIYSGSGPFELHGGGGNDTLVSWSEAQGPEADNILDGGTGTDVLQAFYLDGYTISNFEILEVGYTTARLDQLQQFEELRKINWAVDITLGLTGAGGAFDFAVRSQAGTAFSLYADGLTGGVNFTLGSGNDFVLGTGFADTLIGGAGNDALDGGLDADRLVGGTGDDVYTVDNAGDQVIEGAAAGNDTVLAGISYKAGANVETVVLTGTASTAAYGNGLANRLTGNAGNNTLSGGEGADTLSGGEGNDKLDGGADTDSLSGGTGADALGGGDGADTLAGDAGDDRLNGGAGVDGLSGGDGNDILDGGMGDDQLWGGAGDDTYVVDQAGDVVSEVASQGIDTVKSTISYTLTSAVEELVLTGTGNTNGSGNGLDNTLRGNAGNNALSGSIGHDKLFGGAGNDTLTGGDGLDWLEGGAGADNFVFNAPVAGSSDMIADFEHGLDRLVFSASDFGFTAGHVLTAAEFTEGYMAVGTSAQFVYRPSPEGNLFWDSNGSADGGMISLARIYGTVTADDIVFG